MILARLAPEEQEAVISALGLLVDAAAEDHGITVSRPVPL